MNLNQRINSIQARYKIFLAGNKINRVVFIVFLLIIFSFGLFFISAQDTNRSEPPQNFFFSSSYEPDQLIVKLKSNYTKEELLVLDKAFSQAGVLGQQKAYKSKKSYLNDYYLLKFKKDTNLPKAKSILDSTGQIEVSHPNYIFQIQSEVPNDPYYSRQWDFARIGMPAAWDITRGSENIKVAVIDTGIDYNGEEFVGRKIVKGENFAYCKSARNKNGFCMSAPGRDPLDDHGHGTHVAGTIGAMSNNGLGVAGMLWNTTLLAIKTMKSDGRGDMSDNVDGLANAMELGARVINMSLTSGKGTNLCSNVPELQKTIDDAVSRGIVVVVAAGNENQDASNEAPPSCSGVIVVGASTMDDKRWPSSNYGPRVDISAPGAGIISSFTGNRYAINDGTSMAAPHVAAAAALILSINPALTPRAVLSCLVDNADSINTDKPIGKRLNVAKALSACSGIKISPASAVVAPAGLQKVVVGSLPADVYLNPSTASPKIGLANPGAAYSFEDENDSWLLIKLQNGTSGWISKTLASKTNVNAGPTEASQNIQQKVTTPASSKTYTCRMEGDTSARGTITIGNLICTQN